MSTEPLKYEYEPVALATPLHGRVGGLSVALRLARESPTDTRGRNHSEWILEPTGATGSRCSVSWCCFRTWRGAKVISEFHYNHQQIGAPIGIHAVRVSMDVEEQDFWKTQPGGRMTTQTIRRTMATPIGIIFAANDMLAAQALAGLTAEEVWHRPTDRNNPMLWIAGHLVQTRTELLGLLGDPFDTGWGGRFARGATLGEPDSYPTREEVERTMREVSKRLHAKLAALDDTQLAQPPSIAAPGVSTITDQIAGFAFHDSYHVGQMGFIRKALGYQALAG